MKCKKCGVNIPDGEIACPSCHLSVALMSQIKTTEEQVDFQELDELPKDEIDPAPAEVIPNQEPVVIQFDANVLKEQNIDSVSLAQETPVEENLTNTPMKPIMEPLEESVDAEEVKKALEQYDPAPAKDIHFFLPIIIGMIVLIVIVIGIFYGLKVLL